MEKESRELPTRYNPKDVEDRIYAMWEDSGYFNPDKLRANRTAHSAKRSYCITVPPPNVTGSLHMGHALNAVIQDILIRKKRMQGFQTLWVPGTDHAGIATQNVVEKQLKKEEDLTRHDIGREKLLERIWQWKEKYGNTILDQFKKMGCSMDWSRARFTMDMEYQEAVKYAFLHYYKKGWIYRGERAVNWCTRCATSLSDLEVEYKEEDAQWYEIQYGPLVIGTTRPETKVGDTAIAVNPKDTRYKTYIGTELDVETVLGPAKMKVVADPEVDMNFGTGAMKVTPAHDLHDFELAERCGLEKKQVIGPDGRMTALAGKYAGLKVKEAREQIAKDIETKGLLVSRKPYRHSVAVCYRCGTVLEPILSTQWFLKMNGLARSALAAVRSGKVKFYPKRWGKVYFDWLKRIRDWTISRQIWWGHQLPVWYCQTGRNSKQQVPIPKQIPNRKMTGNRKSEIGNSSADQFVVALEEPQRCPFCQECQMQQSADVLDTWFSSALWPFATLGWPNGCEQSAKRKAQSVCTPKNGSDLANFYPTQVLSTARDIINLWVSRMIFSGLEFMDKEPFRDVIIHATVLTKEGRRMSKSLGTGIDPMVLIEKYGADATRFGLIWQYMGGQDIHFDETAMETGRRFITKLWNATRFAAMRSVNLERSEKVSRIAGDRKILEKLERVVKATDRDIEHYEFGRALRRLYDFFWDDVANGYLEQTKDRTDAGAGRTLETLLETSIKLLHPFIPFVTEELWSIMHEVDQATKRPRTLLLVEGWPIITGKSLSANRKSL